MTWLRASAVLSVLFASSCQSGPGDTTFDITFDRCQVIVLAPDHTAGAEELASIDDAIAHWNSTGATRLTRVGMPDEDPDGLYLPIRFERAAPAFFGIYEDEVGEVIINTELRDRHARAVTIAHEVGHALGLPHVARSERVSVMHTANLKIWPTDSDAVALEHIWGACQPVAVTLGSEALQPTP